MLVERSQGSSQWVVPLVGAIGLTTTAIMLGSKHLNTSLDTALKSNQSNISLEDMNIVEAKKSAVHLGPIKKQKQENKKKARAYGDENDPVSSNQLINDSVSLKKKPLSQSGTLVFGKGNMKMDCQRILSDKKRVLVKNPTCISITFEMTRENGDKFSSCQKSTINQLFCKLLQNLLLAKGSTMHSMSEPKVCFSSNKLCELETKSVVHTWKFSCVAAKGDALSTSRCVRMIWETIMDIRLGGYTESDLIRALDSLRSEFSGNNLNETMSSSQVDRLRFIRRCLIPEIESIARSFKLKKMAYAIKIHQPIPFSKTKNKGDRKVLRHYNEAENSSLIHEMEKLMQSMETKRTWV